MWVDAEAVGSYIFFPRMVRWRCVLRGVRKCVVACLRSCRHREGEGLHLRAMPVRLPARLVGSAFPGLLEGAGDAYAWGAAGREHGVQARGITVGSEAALAPGGLDVVEPGVQRDELLAADVVDAGAVVVGVGLAFHEPAGAEDRQVLADERLACTEGVGERGRGAGLHCEFPHDALADGLGERDERGHGRGWRAALAAAFLRVTSVMHLLILVFPGSRVFMRVACGRGAGRAVLLCRGGALCGLSLVGRQSGTQSQLIVDVACPAGCPGSTFLCCQHEAGRPAGGVAGVSETVCPREDWI